MKRIFTILIAAGFVLPPCPWAAEAGCRHVQVVQQQAVVAYQPVTQPYYWAVGANLQEDAAAQRIAAKVLQLLQGQAQQLATPQTMPLTIAPSLASTKCASCHGGTNAKATAALNLSDLANLDCETKLKMIRETVTGRMPKGAPLTAQELGDLIGELSGEPAQ